MVLNKYINLKMNNIDALLIEKIYFKDKNGKNKINFRKVKNLNNDELEYLNNRFSDSDSLSESIQRILHGIEEKPKCPICGNPVKWLGKPNRLMLNTCSLECGFKLRTQHIKETCQEKYGVSNCFASDEKKQKIKETNLKRYGVDNPHKNKQVIEKTRNTCLERYGVLNGGGTPEAIKKIKQTKLERYGDENFVNVEKCKQTKFEKYGNPNYTNMDKNIKTCKAKYNVDYWFQSIEYKSNIKEYQRKARQTKIKNNTLVNSKLESMAYNLLKKYFSDIKCQWKDDEKYPYNCDFYIPKIDTWIEIQGFVTHGPEQFDENNIEHLEKVSILKQKNMAHKTPNKNLYFAIIKCWTELDVEKRNTAKRNNLNYKEFWNIEQLKEWLLQYERIN